MRGLVLVGVDVAQASIAAIAHALAEVLEYLVNDLLTRPQHAMRGNKILDTFVRVSCATHPRIRKGFIFLKGFDVVFSRLGVVAVFGQDFISQLRVVAKHIRVNRIVDGIVVSIS